MTDTIFGSELVLHAGGIDLAFPHHNNEIAQCEAHNGAEVGRLKLDVVLLLRMIVLFCSRTGARISSTLAIYISKDSSEFPGTKVWPRCILLFDADCVVFVECPSH